MMRGGYWYLFAPLVGALLLSGCRFGESGRDSWRVEAEEQCLAAKGVVPSAFMEPLSAISGDGACGIEYPFRVHAFAEGNVVVEPAARLACPVIQATDDWVKEVVEPAAIAWLGQPVVAIRQMSSYSCRTMNGQVGTKISEHAFGNALDVGAFRTADGQWITVKNGWKGTQEERGFLLQVQAGACERFTTVLAPGSNVFHYDHIHVDLMRHAKGRTICKPAPKPMPAPAMATMPPPAPTPVALPQVQEPPPQAAPDPIPERPQLFAPQPAPQAAEPPPLEQSPLPPPVAMQPAPQPPQAMAPPQNMAPPQSLPSRAPAPAPTPARGSNQLPPGWQVGPEGIRQPGPMSYVPGKGGVETTGSIPKRKYYSASIPQASTIPLPQAKAGED